MAPVSQKLAFCGVSIRRGHRTFDESLRQGALFFLSEGKPTSIEIPEGNRPG